MSSIFAFLHHVAAFALVGALAVEFVLIGGELSVANARRLQVTDIVLGASAVIVLVVGFLRVFYFEKGATYYFHSVSFIAKVSLFVVLVILSIYPTIEFLSWRASLKQGVVPPRAIARIRVIRAIIHMELMGVVLILLCAALMARGVGYVGE